MRVLVNNNFWVPEYLPVVGKEAIREGLIPDLKDILGMYTIIIYT
jgi:hypothetical protein